MLDRTTILRNNTRRDVINNEADFAQRHHTISLYEMRLLSFVGVSDEERSSPQNIILNIDIGIDRSGLGFADNIEHTVDYAEVVKRINEEAAKTHFSLLETLAERICEIMFSEFSVRSISLELFKLDIFENVKFSGIRMERRIDE